MFFKRCKNFSEASRQDEIFVWSQERKKMFNKKKKIGCSTKRSPSGALIVLPLRIRRLCSLSSDRYLIRPFLCAVSNVQSISFPVSNNCLLLWEHFLIDHVFSLSFQNTIGMSEETIELYGKNIEAIPW